MTEYLDTVLNPTALVGQVDAPTLRAGGNRNSVATSDMSDWVLYVATALFISDVLVCWCQ